MTEHTQLATTTRDRFLQAAEKELIAFERREREFLRKDREERAAKLQFPGLHLPAQSPNKKTARRRSHSNGKFGI
jgi:hypothetical protein